MNFAEWWNPGARAEAELEASIASKALRDPGSVTKSQIKTIAASAITQRPDHKPSKPPTRRK